MDAPRPEPRPEPVEGAGPERRLLSERLEAFLDQLREGVTPNFGSFCGSCYNPLPAGQERSPLSPVLSLSKGLPKGCDHCDQGPRDRPPVTSVPAEVIEMHRRKQRRESLIVNAFAYLGLLLGVAIFVGLVAIDVFYLGGALWLLVLSLVALLLGSRLLAGLLGGVIGDELGYRYASRRLAEEWAAYVAQREGEQRD